MRDITRPTSQPATSATGRLSLGHAEPKLFHTSKFCKRLADQVLPFPLVWYPIPRVVGHARRRVRSCLLTATGCPFGAGQAGPGFAEQSTSIHPPGFQAPVGTWNLKTHEVSMEIFLWFIAMIWGSYQYEPTFLLLLAFICLAITFVLSRLLWRRTKRSKANL